ncbi:MAG: DUF3696 domain-containing protein [Candidatus Poribacteria bacterium]|nr:DUF3696 domain-containing protein [Candidatus Poribacteria bacterium]
MLHALELENFKAFGKRARIPFAPITLIFGENSAGKSSILQALYLLKQTLERRDTGALLLPRTENGLVDLGSFQEMLFDHDLKRTLSIRVDTKLDRELGIEFSFKRPSLEEEVLLDQINIYDGKSAKCTAKFQPLHTIEDPVEFWARMGMLFDVSNSLPLPLESSTVECVWVTTEPEYWKPEFEWCKENMEVILSNLKRSKAWFKRKNDEMNIREDTFRNFFDLLNTDIELFSSDFDLETYISKSYKEKMNTILSIRGFLPNDTLCINRRNDWITEPESLFSRRSDDTSIFDPAQLAIATSSALEETLEALFPISPFRKPPERWYIFRGTSPSHVGYQGDLLPDLLLRRPELVNETNEWLKRLEIDYALEVKPIGTDSGDFFEVRLIDTRRREPVSVALPDVGFGVSQLLPFIVQSLVSEGQIISIEQPEVHVHPKLQADLGDLLAEAIKEPRQNRFIIETHSEHLILRLQRLVRKKQIEPEDVSVIYVNRGPEGAKAERLHLDEDGDFIDDWPNGFFTERLREL